METTRRRADDILDIWTAIKRRLHLLTTHDDMDDVGMFMLLLS